MGILIKRHLRIKKPPKLKKLLIKLTKPSLSLKYMLFSKNLLSPVTSMRLKWKRSHLT